MLRPSKSLALVLILVSISLATPIRSSACGGFFCQNVPIDQTAERIIFAIDRANNMTTTVVGISYTGAAEAFSWVIPVSSPPKLDVAETKSLDALSNATNIQFVAPPDPCIRAMSIADDGAVNAPEPPTGGSFLQTGQVGPYDYAIIKNTKVTEMIAWLRENGYRVTPEMEPLIIQYVQEGSYFLAMKLRRGVEATEIKPIVMTYPGTTPLIPLRLTAVAAVPNMQVLVWILGDVQYVPQNYAHPSVDFSRMRAGFQTVNENGSSYTTLISYQNERKFLQQKYDGRAFITEYAQPLSTLNSSSEMSAAGKPDPVIGGLLKKHHYVTRLRAQISPEQMKLDPAFEPDSSAPNVSNVIEIGRYMDPSTFWGCGK